METVSDFILGGSQITTDGDCSHEIKRLLLLEREVMTNLDSILKSRRDIIFPAKVCLVKAMVFPVVMYGCESWTIKVERGRIDAFELWCWRRLLKSVLNIHWKDWSFKLKLQFFGHLMAKNWLIWKDPDARKDWGQEEKGTAEDEMVERHHWLSGYEFYSQ